MLRGLLSLNGVIRQRGYLSVAYPSAKPSVRAVSVLLISQKFRQYWVPITHTDTFRKSQLTASHRWRTQLRAVDWPIPAGARL